MPDQSKKEQLIADVESVFAMGREYAYIEVGKYKGYQVGTVRALARMGYRIERKVLGGAYHIYPKPKAPPEKTYTVQLTEGEIIAIREAVRKFPRSLPFAQDYAAELASLDKMTTEQLAAIFDACHGSGKS
jgi:hypothetical protein